VARHRRRNTEWQLDLKPVLPSDHAVDRNGASPSPALRPRQDDAAVLEALSQIQLAVAGLRETVDQLSARLDGIDQRLAARPAAATERRATRPPRQVREPSEVRDSAAVSFERRARRPRTTDPEPVIQDDAAER
jgi:hypothetical protein